MIAVVLVSHGSLADALLSAAERFLGPQADALAFGLGVDETPDAYECRLREGLCALHGGGGILILADLWGGTPANLALAVCREQPSPGCAIIGAASLPLVVEALAARDTASSALELGRMVMEVARGPVYGYPAELTGG